MHNIAMHMHVQVYSYMYSICTSVYAYSMHSSLCIVVYACITLFHAFPVFQRKTLYINCVS